MHSMLKYGRIVLNTVRNSLVWLLFGLLNASQLKGHIQFLARQLDPIRDLSPLEPLSRRLSQNRRQQKQQRHPNSHYAFALLVVMLTPIYGTIGLQSECNRTPWPIDWRGLVRGVCVFTHQIVPPAMWANFDVAMTFDLVATIPMYTVMALRPVIDDRFRMFSIVVTGGGDRQQFVIGSKLLGRKECEQIYKFRHQIKKFLFLLVAIFYSLCLAYFEFQVWFNLVSFSVGSALFWLIAFPLYLFYLIYALFASVVYVIMASRYLQIRQKYLLHQLRKLNARMLASSISSSSVANWPHFMHLQQQIVSLCTDIEAYSDFCVPFLTIIIPFYVALQSYVLYILLYIGAIPLSQKQHFLYAVILIEFLLFAIIYQCALVGKANEEIQYENRRYYLTYYERKGQHEQKLLQVRREYHLLKSEGLQQSDLLRSYVFRMFARYRITTNTFNQILANFTVFFMLVIKNQLKLN